VGLLGGVVSVSDCGAILLGFAFYPITKRIGLGTNVKESVFMSYAGFRGAVGIALSLSLGQMELQVSAICSYLTFYYAH
jgi:NhaP-type Na+/H+ or K+/H+ antiporter